MRWGDNMAIDARTVYPSLTWVQEYEVGNSGPQISCAQGNTDLCGPTANRMMGKLRMGFTADYVNTENLIRRTRGIPYNRNDVPETEIIMEQFRKEISKKRMFFCATSTADLSFPIHATPAMTVGK